jgi:hypothetical protein
VSARSGIGWTATALGALFAGMVAWALLSVERPETAARATRDRESRVLPFSPGDAVAVSITPRSGPAIQLERTREGWRFLSPSPGPASALAVEGFLGRLAAIRARSTLPPGGAMPAALGLEPPVARLAVTLREGPPLGIDLGDESPFDGTRYCRSAGAIQLVEGTPPAAVDLVPDAFRAGADAR